MSLAMAASLCTQKSLYNPCLHVPSFRSLPQSRFLHLLRPRASVAGVRYSRVAADPSRFQLSRESIDILQDVLLSAANRGAEVVMEAVDKPRSIDYKGKADLVTDTDKRCELAILDVVNAKCPDHLILGEEGGVSGDPTSPFLWCIDPLDGTTNFAHGYPSFAVSIAVLYRGKPLAASVVEFAGGPFCWVTRTFTASAGGGAFCNGNKITVSQSTEVEKSLFVTGFGYEHDEPWATNIQLFKEFTDISRILERIAPPSVRLKEKGFDFSRWFKPDGYILDL